MALEPEPQAPAEPPWSLAVLPLLLLIWAGPWPQLALTLLTLAWVIAGQLGLLTPSPDRIVRMAIQGLAEGLFPGRGLSDSESDRRQHDEPGLPPQRLEELLAAVKMAVVCLDAEGRICSLNSSAAAMLNKAQATQGTSQPHRRSLLVAALTKELQASLLGSSVAAGCMQGPGFNEAAAALIARTQGAELRLESDEVQGIKVTVSLSCQQEKPCIEPIRDDELELDYPMPFHRSYSMERAGRQRPLILSVDDDEINQEVICQSLGDDYDLKCCMDGQSALDWLELNKANLPDVILLDIQMPGMTGYEVCKRIRENYNESLWELPITLLSAKAPASAVAMEGFNNGSTDFIAKPFDSELLRKKVSLSLDMKRSLPPKSRLLDEVVNSKIAKAQAVMAYSECARKQAAVLLHEHKEQIETLEARLEGRDQEIHELQEELLKAREAAAAKEKRGKSSSPEKRKKSRKPNHEEHALDSLREEQLLKELAAQREKSAHVAQRLLLQTQLFQSFQKALGEEELDAEGRSEDDFFGWQAFKQELLKFNPFLPQCDAVVGLPDHLAGVHFPSEADLSHP